MNRRSIFLNATNWVIMVILISLFSYKLSAQSNLDDNSPVSMIKIYKELEGKLIYTLNYKYDEMGFLVEADSLLEKNLSKCYVSILPVVTGKIDEYQQSFVAILEKFYKRTT